MLRDADARLAYDAEGAAALSDGQVNRDSALGMFEAVFGSAAFEPFVGRFPVLEQASLYVCV